MHPLMLMPMAQATCPKCGMPLANNGKCPFCDKR